jgi:protein tyrosine phosphatase (PTP) superfamily phosphohydrolase (DUF442 family)
MPDHRPDQQPDHDEIREAAEAVGVEDTEGKSDEELVHEAQEANEDSAVSPTQWQVDSDDAAT